MITAAEFGWLDKLHALLQDGQSKGLSAEVNCTSLDNWTPLHFAANEGHAEIVDALLKQKGIEVSPVSKLRRTPLHLACVRGNQDIVRSLRDAGADLTLADHEGNTPLHLASESGTTNCIIFLLKECDGVNITARNNLGQTPNEIC